MSIDEQIKILEDNAEHIRKEGDLQGCLNFRQLMEWLKDYKRLLEQEPKTGHWTRELIRNEKGGCIGAKRICSECGNDNKHDEYMNYCPNCGAKMQEVEE